VLLVVENASTAGCVVAFPVSDDGYISRLALLAYRIKSDGASCHDDSE
jgi:hypothetical protein